MQDRAEALKEILDIARRHELGPEDITRAFQPADEGAPRGVRAVLPKLFAYLGGTFVFAGLAVFIGLNWDQMNAAARIIITLGSGLAAYGMALAATTQPRYEKAVTPLFLISAILQPTGILVALDELSSGGDWRYALLTMTGVMVLQQGLTFSIKRRTTLLFTTLFFGAIFLFVTFDLLDIPEEFNGLVIGLSLLLITTGLVRTRHQSMAPFWYLVGSTVFFYCVFEILERTPFEILFLGIACGIVFLSVSVHSRTLLAVGTLATLAYIGYFTNLHFVASWGWPLALVVFGLVMIGLSAAAVRINQKYIQK